METQIFMDFKVTILRSVKTPPFDLIDFLTFLPLLITLLFVYLQEV